jgi:2-iminobutanoate/2-iminopropanoate deaminase
LSDAPKAVRSADAPAPIGPYSQALASGGWLYCSGQIALDPKTGEIVAGGVAAETRQVLANVGAVLAEAGIGFGDVVKTTIYLVDLADFATVNAVYAERFTAPFPARSTVGVAALPRGARVEIEVIAKLR